MSLPRVALPPGTYNIRNGALYVTKPRNIGDQLFVAAVGPDQQFLIDGSGNITSIPAGGDVALPSVGAKWIINVVLNANNTWTGFIRADGIHQLFWGLNGNNVQLQANTFDWTFVQVT